MRTLRGLIVIAGLACLTTPASGQDRSVQIQVLGGGYSHINNLNVTGPDAHFKPGYNVGLAVGVMASKYVGIHADFTYARTQAKGAVAFTGDEVNRYFYGGHIELRYPVTANLSPFVFGGAGAATIQQSGSVVSFNRFTKLAGMFGAGLAYRVPGSPIDLLAEGKALTFKWDAAGFNRNQLDVTYSVGFAYRFGL